MAKASYTFSGGAPVLKRYKIGASMTTKGIMAIGGATTTAGLAISTTTSWAKAVGLTLDAGTYTTTQSTTMTEGLVTVVVNPDLVSRWRMSGTTASGGALGISTNSAASAGGTAHTITTGDAAPNSPTVLDGTIIYISGNNVALPAFLAANAGASASSSGAALNVTGSRAITTVTATVATVLVPFPYTIASGDVAIFVPFPQGCHYTLSNKYPILTTTLDEVRANAALAASGSGVAARIVELVWDSPAGTGTNSPVRTNSAALMVADDHVFNVTT